MDDNSGDSAHARRKNENRRCQGGATLEHLHRNVRDSPCLSEHNIRSLPSVDRSTSHWLLADKFRPHTPVLPGCQGVPLSKWYSICAHSVPSERYFVRCYLGDCGLLLFSF